MTDRRAARWTLSLLALTLLVSAAVYFLAPRRVTRVSLVDGDANWQADEAPPRRQIVWQSADAIAAVGLDLAPGDSVIRPHLADGGSTLFFTLRRAGGDADIFRSRLIDGAWQGAVSVEAINSDAEDIGPSLTRDGRTLYLYSNRPGGFGGFDVFVSERTAEGWSEPQNLGGRVNSVADEYDPTVSPDGTRLFYSSNRSDELQRRIAVDGGVADSDDWSTTLRAQATSKTFDLFLAERKTTRDAWHVPRPLDELNRNDDNEGAPFVSPNGVFLYFTSNRPWRAGETTNFDIYRARIEGARFGQVQNLGPGVNSAANEMEPALSNEGFRLYFSRNAEPADGQTSRRYGLFASTATEITETRSWDAANSRALLSWFIQNGSWLIAAALLCCLLAGLVWYLRQVSLKRATVPGFFLCAMLIHLLIVGSLFVVALDDDLRNRLKDEVQELVVAVQMDDSPAPQQAKPEFGNQADSQSVETVEPANVQRQSVVTPPIEAPSENPGPAPAVPSELPFVAPSEQVVTKQPELKMPTDKLKLGRQQRRDDQPIEIVETIEIQPVEETAETEPATLDVDLTQQQPIAELTASPKPQTPSDATTPLRPEPVALQRATSQPPTSVVASEAPTLIRKASLEVGMTESKVETEEVAAAEQPDSPSAPTAIAVDIARQAAQETSTPTVGLPPRRSSLAGKPVVSSESVPVQRTGDKPLEVRSPSKPVALARADRRALSDSPAESVPTESVAGPATPSSAEPAKTTIELARQSNQAPVQPIAGLPSRRESVLAPAPAPASETLMAERTVLQPVDVAGVAEPIVLARAGRPGVPLDSPSESMQIEDVAEPANTSKQTVPNAVSQVRVTRQEILSELAPATETISKEAHLDTPLAAAKVQPSPLQAEVAPPTPTENPTTLAMLRRPPAAGFESTSERIETIEQATGEAGGEANVDPSSPAVSVGRAGEVSPLPKTLPAGLTTATAQRLLTVDRQAVEIATLDTLSEPRSAASPAPIARLSAATSREDEEEIATEEVAANVPVKPDQLPTGVAVGAARAESQVVETLHREVALNSLPRQVAISRLAMTTPNKDGSHDGPEFDLTPNSLARNTSRQPLRLSYAEDNIGLQAMLRLRQSEAKKDLLEAFGGNTNTESAVERGLNWMELHQHDEGRWSLNRFTELCEKHHKAHKCTGTGGASDTAATGFALLPFLGAGHTHQDGDHQEVVSRGLKWLVEKQKPDGDLFVGGGGNTHMYSHGIAAIALCEAYAMTRDPALQGPAQKAIDFIVAAQHPKSGGWRYKPRQDGDTSVFGWQVMALKSGQMAELNVPQATLDKAKLWLKHVGAKGKNEGRFGYTNSSPNVTMTAEGLLCLQYLGAERNDSRLIAGSSFLAENLPAKETSYYWYYGTQVMFHMQGEPWQKWNAALRNSLVETQVKQGSMAGTWDPKDNWEKTGGRIYATALRVLMLEVYYRHLPLYQVLDE